jgi:hypothetical protein
LSMILSEKSATFWDQALGETGPPVLIPLFGGQQGGRS